MKKFDCKTTVHKLLSLVPEVRDNDVKLIHEVWKIETVFGEDLEKMEIRMLFGMMLDGRISESSTIRRIRRRLQQLHPDLRGYKYQKRHQLQEVVIDEVETMGAEATSPSYDLTAEFAKALGFGGSDGNK